MLTAASAAQPILNEEPHLSFGCRGAFQKRPPSQSRSLGLSQWTIGMEILQRYGKVLQDEVLAMKSPWITKASRAASSLFECATAEPARA